MSEQKSSSTPSTTPSEKKQEEKKVDSTDDKDESSSPTAFERSAYTTSLVVVHPLVLLSVVDHYTRVAKDTKNRVVGVLLGETYKGKVDITNSYAVPFEEDPKDPNIWYIDRQYHEDMFAMFKKVNAREKIVGWYSTGPKIRPADLEINEMFRSYTVDPVLVIIDVNPKGDPLEIPTQAYTSIEAKPEEKSVTRRQFTHVLSQIGAYEAEEVGVEHLLRNIVDTTESSMTDQVRAKVRSLKGLKNRLEEISEYVNNVLSNKLPANHQILYNLQDIFNLLPDLETQSMIKSLATNTNDNMMAIYVSSLVRSICALHDLIHNKLVNKQHEIEEGKTEEEKRADKKKKEAEEKKKKEAAAAKKDEKKKSSD